MSAPVVELINVSVQFSLPGNRRLQAVRDVSMAIQAGEIVTVVGESGCGKSTIGKVALGLQRPVSGEVRYGGRDIGARGFHMTKAERLSVAVVHQDSYASLNPVKTVGQILSAPLLRHAVAGTREVQQRVLDLLTKVGLTPSQYFANKYPFQLSGGQRQRVSLARSTLLSPKLIVADEPVSGVDASLRLSILDLMQDLNRRLGIAFLYITHDLATARYFGAGGRLVVMYLGQVVEEGDVGEVIDRPRHPYLQALLAAISPPDPQAAHTRVPLPLKSVEMPDPTRPPGGCAFHPRCIYADTLCESQAPAVEIVNPSHQVRCHHWQNLEEKVLRDP